MRLRSAAAAAAGVVAAIGLNAHKASADPVDESAAQSDPQLATTTTTAPQPPEWFSERDKERFARGQAEAAEDPEPVRPQQKVIEFQEVDQPGPAPRIAPQLAVAITTAPAAPTHEPVPPQPHERKPGETSSVAEAAAQPAAESPVPGAPSEPVKSQSPAASPVQNAVMTKAVESAPKATPPSVVDPVSAGDEWYPAWVGAEADQRIAEKWRTAPVRGPPPSVATALGNSSTNTVTQIAVVRGPFGTDVAVATQSQRSDVTNVGVATADAAGGGTASATGNQADTSVIQVSVIVQRGTGSATIEQNSDVDNIGVASATSAGTATATAVGNNSSTNVTQVAVVYVEGSGDAHVTQTTDVDNVGVAAADATSGSATAIGNQSTTTVTQVSVVHVRNEDVTVNQTSTNTNIGVATADGGAATGNTATNVTTQVGHVPR